MDTVKELEGKIYDTYYDNGGDDARTSGLWKAVLGAKGDIGELELIFEDVKSGGY